MSIKAFSLASVDSRFEFTNVNCTSFDKEILEFEYCYIKSINRTYKYLSGKVKLHEIPFANLAVNLVMWKRFNGYRPFLYNITVNGCKFLDNPKSNPVAKFIYDSYTPYSNLNHSCPYMNDLVLDKLPVEFLNHRVTKILPFPEGDYLFEFRWIRSRNVFANIKIYFKLY
ncbi:uncharacterized protein [Drosophila kikkawai]|uniref:Uncharacterized protein n=1 Tax=Drosophila kikkawai TaxID=30033 RepID=A0A6P4J906_DROKI|nr:uncharacterized protein LOC108085317 [Drosophila kikkawai]